MTTATNIDTVLNALRANVEDVFEDANGEKWGVVYLDNARSDCGMDWPQFAGYLSALKGSDLYDPDDDDCFGLVRIK